MRQPATHSRLRDGIEGLCDRVEPRVDRPRCGASHSRFALRPAGLARVAGGRRRRQRQASGPSGCAQRCAARDLRGREMLPQHDVAGLQRRPQASAAPTAQAVPLDRPVDAPGRVEPRKAPRRAPRLIAPIIVWDLLDHPRPGGGPALAAEPRQGETRCLHAWQPVDVAGWNRRAARGAERLDARGLPRCGVERLFFPGASDAVRRGQWLPGCPAVRGQPPPRARTSASGASGWWATSWAHSARGSVRALGRPPA
jgi:hypothetical protein